MPTRAVVFEPAPGTGPGSPGSGNFAVCPKGPGHACRWYLAAGLDQRGHGRPGHDVGPSDTWTNRDFAGALST